MDTFADLHNVVALFGRLDEDWDGYGASAISDMACKNADRFIALMETSIPLIPTPEIAPMPNGTVMFEWETPDVEVCIEIGNTLYSGFIISGCGTEYLDGAAANLDGDLVAKIANAL